MKNSGSLLLRKFCCFFLIKAVFILGVLKLKYNIKENCALTMLGNGRHADENCPWWFNSIVWKGCADYCSHRRGTAVLA
jgi:hypothetical protein